MLLLVIIVFSLFVIGIVAYLINNKNTEKSGNGLDTHVSFSNQIACSPQSGEEENERDYYLDGLENRIKILEQANTGTDVLRKRILDHQIALQKKNVETYRVRKLRLKPESPKRTEEINRLEGNILELNKEEQRTRIDILEGCTEEQKHLYEDMVTAFNTLRNSGVVWKVKCTPYDKTILDRTSAAFREESFSLLEDKRPVPYMSGCYIYPTHIIYSNSTNSYEFKTIPIKEATLDYDKIRFIESEFRFYDAEVYGYTYEHVNKNGKPDLRYSDNPRYPVYFYGEFCFCGLEPTFMASNEKAASTFAKAFSNYIKSLKGEKIIPSVVGHKTTMPAFTPSAINKYEDAIEISKKLIAFFDKVISNDSFCRLFEAKVSIDYFMDAFKVSTIKDVMLALFREDIVKAHKGLGHRIDLTKKEGMPIAIFLYMTSGSEEIEPHPVDIDFYLRKIRPALEYSIAQLESVIKENNVFFYVETLKEYDQTLLKEYVTLLSAFASLVANADKMINGTEYQWIQSLMLLQNSPEAAS